MKFMTQDCSFPLVKVRHLMFSQILKINSILTYFMKKHEINCDAEIELSPKTFKSHQLLMFLLYAFV